MKTIVLFTALLVSQTPCRNGLCPTGQPGLISGYGEFLDQPPFLPPTQQIVVQRPAPTRQKVVVDGVTIEVMGWNAGNNMIEWKRADPFNVRSLELLRQHQANVKADALAKAESATKERARAQLEADRQAAALAAKQRSDEVTAQVDAALKRLKPVTTAPDSQPLQKVASQPPGKNYGLKPDWSSKKGEAFTAPSPEAKAFVAQARAAQGVEGKMHVTVIGSDDARAPVVNDLNTHPALAPFRDKLHVQDYKPSEWPVDPKLGYGDGSPTIIVQQGKVPGDPNGGKVLWRAANYAEGPDGLAEGLRQADALRKGVPGRDPSQDPGPATGRRKGGSSASGCPFGFDKSHWPFILIVGAFAGALLLLPRKEG
jgi:hypothetical protein